MKPAIPMPSKTPVTTAGPRRGAARSRSAPVTRSVRVVSIAHLRSPVYGVLLAATGGRDNAGPVPPRRPVALLATAAWSVPGACAWYVSYRPGRVHDGMSLSTTTKVRMTWPHAVACHHIPLDVTEPLWLTRHVLAAAGRARRAPRARLPRSDPPCRNTPRCPCPAPPPPWGR